MKTDFAKLIQPHCQITAAAVSEREVVLCVGDTTFLDYGKIVVKRQGYGPTGNGGNGLILHSALALDAQQGQPLGLIWQKLWNRQPKEKPPVDETPVQKKQRQAMLEKQLASVCLKTRNLIGGWKQLKRLTNRLRTQHQHV